MPDYSVAQNIFDGLLASMVGIVDPRNLRDGVAQGTLQQLLCRVGLCITLCRG